MKKRLTAWVLGLSILLGSQALNLKAEPKLPEFKSKESYQTLFEDALRLTEVQKLPDSPLKLQDLRLPGESYEGTYHVLGSVLDPRLDSLKGQKLEATEGCVIKEAPGVYRVWGKTQNLTNKEIQDFEITGSKKGDRYQAHYLPHDQIQEGEEPSTQPVLELLTPFLKENPKLYLYDETETTYDLLSEELSVWGRLRLTVDKGTQTILSIETLPVKDTDIIQIIKLELDLGETSTLETQQED